MGFSLGGNVVLKLAGELGARNEGWIDGVCAISAPIDLAACAKRLQEPRNWVYEQRFVARMKRRILATGRFTETQLGNPKSIYEIDNRITAPSFGFGSADHYYATQSSQDFLEGIRVPALVIQAEDDPLVPFEIFGHRAFKANPRLRMLATQRGGHVAFLSKSHPRFWVDEKVVAWASQVSRAA